MKRRVLGGAMAAVAVAGVVAGCSSSKPSSTATTQAAGSSGSTGSGGSTGNSANKASAPGVTASDITIGYVTSLTGNASSSYSDATSGIQAVIDSVNAAGGVNGRKLKLVTADDQSSPTGDLAAGQELLAKNAFAIVNFSPYAFGGYKYLQQEGVPEVGGAFDASEWGTQPNTNMFATSGGYDPSRPADTSQGMFFKSVGATNVAGIAYGVSPSAVDSIKDLKESLAAEGIKMGYENLSLPFGTVDFTSYALQMKNAGVDGATCSCVQSTNIAMAVGAKQAGINLKGALMFSGADASLFKDPTAVAAAQGTYWPTPDGIVPLDVNNPAATNFVNTLKKYDANYTGGYPSYGLVGSYLSAELMVEGLTVAGQNPTRESFITNLQKVTSWNANGLLANTVGFDHFGTANKINCGYYTKVEGNAFVTINGGKPFCGTLIPNSGVEKTA